MRLLSAEQLHANKVRELGLDPTRLDLKSVEAISAALRRAAGFLCPCSPPTLIRAITGPLEDVVSDRSALRELVEETLDAVVGHGDLMELRDVPGQTEQPGALLYTAPPSFVSRESGAAIVLGIAPDHLSPLPDELRGRLEYVGHVRRLPANPAEPVDAALRQLGFVELSHAAWLREPTAESAAQHIARLDRLLDAACPSVEVPGLSLIEPTRPVTYYRGRWVEPGALTGRFLGRRNQSYGADLWCYVEMDGGRPSRFVDLPLAGSRARGCDEAWRLQMAIDAQRREPQRFRVERGPLRTRVVDLFSPLPMWVRRRWDSVGEPVVRAGCLFSYRFHEDEVPEELIFARETLWLAEVEDSVRK